MYKSGLFYCLELLLPYASREQFEIEIISSQENV